MASSSRPRRARIDLESLTDRLVPATHFYAVGQDIGGASLVRVYAEDGSLNRTLAPFGTGFTGGVRVATGDVTGDGVDDIVTAAGPGGGPEVKVYDGATNAVVRDFFAYDPGFTGGVNVAVGDVTGDGAADIVTGTGIGGGPNVRVFDGATGGLFDSFFAYESSFRGGVNVAAGDVGGDGLAEVITGTGVGGGPRVQVFDGATGLQVLDFFAYDPSVRGGVTVGAGDLSGTGLADIVTGVGPGGGPNVRVYDGQTAVLDESFFAYDPGFLGGVSVDVVTANGAPAVLVAPGPSSGGYVELFDGMTGAGITQFQPFPGFKGGITTGQGVATPDRAMSSYFANPRAFGIGGGTYSTDPGYVYSYDPYSSYYYVDPNAYYTPDPGWYYSDPGYSDPGYSDPGYSDPGYSDPGYGDPGDCGCGDYTDPGDPGDYGDPGYSDPGYSDPGYSDPGYDDSY